ncbi:hypothetical protein [Roseateles sp.]|uniref:hypothetical protein n=1 Tax=Roseateles sp. TaxID=1971397 RepID=UPI003D145532
MDYTTATVDSAPPANAAQLSKCPAELKNGMSCTARVQADQWVSPTGIGTKVIGEIYCVAVWPNQVWFDASRRNSPPDGEKGSWLMNLAKKRHEGAGFFSLMIDVQSAASTGETAKEVGELSGGAFAAPGPGELVLYPNDAIGPVKEPAWYYKNNSGYVWVTIKRCG